MVNVILIVFVGVFDSFETPFSKVRSVDAFLFVLTSSKMIKLCSVNYSVNQG